MKQGVLRVLGQILVVVQEVQISLQIHFRLWKFGFFEEIQITLPLGFDALWGNHSSEEISLCGTDMINVHCQFKACILNAFDCCSQVTDEVVSIIGCDADIVHILGTLIRFIDFVKIFSHETGKCGQCPAKALCLTSVGKRADCEIEG